MKKIKIITDSCTDIEPSRVKEHNVSFIDMSIFLDAKEIVTKSEWRNLSQSELFDSLRVGKKIYTLSATENEIEATFLKYLKQDYDILYIACCEKQSVTIDKARKVAKKLLINYPDSKIEIVDSLNASVGEGLIVLKAVEFVEQGLPLEEVVNKILPLRKRVIQFCTVESLTYLSRANKINSSTAIFGNMFNVKPILVSDVEGKQTSLENVKGRENSLIRIVELFLDNIENPKEQDIYIIHGDDYDAAKYVEDLLKKANFECRNIIKLCIGPVVGVSTGPGMVGIFGFGKEVTFLG